MKTLITLIITSSLISTNTYSQFLNAEQAVRVAALPCEELDMDTFIPLWLEKHRLSKVWGRELREYDADSAYTYFFLYTTKERKRYKVRHTQLQTLDYKSLKGDFIENCFYYNLLHPAFKTPQNKFNTPDIRTVKFTHTYNPRNHTILVTCNYKLVYPLRLRPVKATLTAVYDINKEDFIK